MRVYETKAAIEALYYLIAVDGTVDEDELHQFYELGEKLDRKNFDSYKEELVDACNMQINNSNVGYRYDLIVEGLYNSLLRIPTDEDQGVTGRLLIWDLLVVAFSNGKYDENEKRLISHVARISGVDDDVVADFENTMQTAMAVTRELEWAKNLDRPYSEVKPIVDELEDRLAALLKIAQELIEDEIQADDPFEDTPDMVQNAMDAIDNKMAPVKEKVSDVARNAGDVAKNAGNVAANVAANVGSGVAGAVGGAWKNIMNRKKAGKASEEEQ